MFWTYARNRNPRDSRTSTTIMLDSGVNLVLEMGRVYDLSSAEASRARQWVDLEPGSAPLDLAPDPTGPQLPPYVPSIGGVARETEVFYQPPPLVVGVGHNPFSPVTTRRILGVKAVVDAPLSGTIIVDVNKNGDSIFAGLGSQPSIQAGSHIGGVVELGPVVRVDPADEVTVDLDVADPDDSTRSLSVVLELAAP